MAFAFTGRLRPLPYALAALAVLVAQPLAVGAVLVRLGQRMPSDWLFYVAPLRAVHTIYVQYTAFEVVLLVVLLAASWAQAVLAFRRAADAGASGWLAAATIAPIVQLPAIAALCVMPSRAPDARPADPRAAAANAGWPAAAQGVVAGAAVTLLAVALGALIFGTYGFGLFVVSPFIIGAITGYLANRTGDRGGAATAGLVIAAATLGGVMLLVAALEGAVCIVLVAPLGLAVALVGGVFGRAAAVYTRGSASHAFASLALLPLVFASEQAFPAAATFVTEETIEVAAPPEAVWRALVDMDEIAAPPTLPFRLGVAYPRRGIVVGEGVGATRIGVFSTGVARERVTAWDPARLFAFAVLSEPPAMREFSPYAHVHAPHVEGYFRTLTTSFALEPLAGGGTRIVERTEHLLQLDPVPYWLPLARWVVHLNNARVLAHVRDQAERAAR
jgi:uncharacterized membrane protein YhaH (DUF805 family)